MKLARAGNPFNHGVHGHTGGALVSINPPLIWFLVGVVLLLIEFALPGAIIVFFGLGAWVAALTTWVGLTNSLGWQILVFAVSSAVLLLTLRRRLRGQFLGHSSGQQDLLHDLDEFVGRVVTVTEPIAPDSDGAIEYKGASWEARSMQRFQPGERVRITHVDGIRVTVEPLGSTAVPPEEARQ
jgi:membrane protein implicated in regulation of membrane protease activity